ncbi:MAG: hypothetical protein GPJ22_16335 [Microcystis aeruginosa LL13-03]|jgi:hypothetical protein|nr:hypothetical protein [Microcystis aeruginosa LL13-03]NCR67488.1 hypothetical protein [Microcystis aeruginosa LL11-07]
MNNFSALLKLLNGSGFFLIVILAIWIGYQIGKEAKTNWFKDHSQIGQYLALNKDFDKLV